jgi:hypothetical protein
MSPPAQSVEIQETPNTTHHITHTSIEQQNFFRKIPLAEKMYAVNEQTLAGTNGKAERMATNGRCRIPWKAWLGDKQDADRR